jgi:hypothetical protein
MSTPETRHTFSVLADVAPNGDGTYAVTFDWSDSYLGGIDAADADAHELDDLHPDGPAVSAALHAWATRPTVATVPDPAARPTSPVTAAAAADAVRCALVDESRRLATALIEQTLLTMALRVRAVSPDLPTMVLSPSDQGEWMIVGDLLDTTGASWMDDDTIVGTSPDVDFDLEHELDSLAMDLCAGDGYDGMAWRDARWATDDDGTGRWLIDVDAVLATLAPPATLNPFQPGDLADHRSGTLDPRRVHSTHGDTIRLLIGTTVTPPVPAVNYTRMVIPTRS